METPLIRQRMTPRAAQWRIFATRSGELCLSRAVRAMIGMAGERVGR
jgi:hypothetical protein